MSTHALLSPSGFRAIMLCPAKPAMERGLPDKRSTYADEGTAAHLVGSTCLELGTNASDYLGKRIAIGADSAIWQDADNHGVAYTVDIDMAAHVQVYADTVRDMQGDGVLFVEQSLPIGHVTGEAGAHGTGDAVIIRGSELIIIDLKYGRGVAVDAELNPQLMLYGLGALERFDLVGDIESVRMVISQPRVQRAPLEFAMSSAELYQWGLDYAGPAAQRALELLDSATPEDHCAPQQDACRFCRAKPTCPALGHKVHVSVGAEFTDLTTEDKVAQEQIVKQLTAGLSPELLGAKMSALELIEQWCKAIRGRVEKVLLDGGEVPGFKLVQGKRGSRQWDDDTAAEAVLKSMRLTKDEMYDLKLISPTTAEKTFKDQPKRWAKVAPLIVQPEGKPSVAPIADKRRALEVTPMEQEFAPIADSVGDLV